MDLMGALPEPAAYVAPTAPERWHYLYSNAFSPRAALRYIGTATFSQAGNSIPEWDQGFEGYGKRLGWVSLSEVTHLTAESALAAALHEDVLYYRCSCTGFWRRMGHALWSQAASRRPDGSRQISIARPIGAYAGAFVGISVLPDRFNIKGDGVRNGTYSYAYGFPLNIAREFWPEIRRSVLRRTD